ncbi:klotho [Protopterus annectens]|uniref:klotho n=1 Tax=Protopterus annectens TaxID=7888 RepID=UPI001CFA304E|nr:klotho [Protopterus annectens]
MLAATWSLFLFAFCSTICILTADPDAGKGVWKRFAELPRPEDDLFLYDTFPDGFMWSVGTAAYQIEGAWDGDSKGQSIWDNFTHGSSLWNSSTNTTTSPPVTGDVASDSYNNLEGDLLALQILGVTHYRFSISWPRIFPNGSVTSLNEAGVGYYSKLIQKLKQAGVEPVVTLYHWDLPQTLQDAFGGWTSESIVEIFKDYAEFCFRVFGESVKFWITIDNPYAIARHGYYTGKLAPGVRGDQGTLYRVGHNLIKAHAAVWHLYNETFRQHQGGQVSIALGTHWIKPKHMTDQDIRACQYSLNFVLGWFAKPIFVDGDYPACMRDNLSYLLPVFNESDKMSVRDTADFFALSFGPVLSFQKPDIIPKFKQSESINLRQALSWISAEYNSPKIYIVENGWYASSNTKTEGAKDMHYLKQFITETLKAIKKDNVNVIGYTAWSLIDGFEWDRGYNIRRGLFYVDFLSQDKKRVAKSSAYFYKDVIQKNGFPPLPENEPITGTFQCKFAWGTTANDLQVKAIPSQFTDPNIYIWDIHHTQKLIKVEGMIAPRHIRNCADYGSILQQVSLLREMHVTHFYFPLTWSFMVPTGNISQLNTTMIHDYSCFVSELARANITPAVSLWQPTGQNMGLPSVLHHHGGWNNESTVKAFVDYARVCFKVFGNYVKLWITMNEPNVETLRYVAGRNLLKAHASVWHMYNQEFRKTQNGQISIALLANWIEPAYHMSRSHIETANRVLEFNIGWFAEPIFGSGNYPSTMWDWLHQTNNKHLLNFYSGYFPEKDKEFIRGSFDFFALSHYSTVLVSQEMENDKVYDSYLQKHQMNDITWLTSPNKSAVVPWGLRKMLKWVKSRYGDIPIYIMATGIDDDQKQLDDKIRSYYIQSYVNEALKAYKLDRVDVRGYFVYSFSDKADPSYGLYSYAANEYVPKRSLQYYKKIIDSNGFLDPDTAIRECPEEYVSCPGCFFQTRKSLLAFIAFICFAFVVTVILVIYYSRKGKKNYSVYRL